MTTVQLATSADQRWSQQMVERYHYRHTPVDVRGSLLTYLICREQQRVGCLIFARPESTCCYEGQLTYGSPQDVTIGRAICSRWELINLARVWLHPDVQQGGSLYIPNLATWAIGTALKRVVLDYLLRFPPCFPDEPWRLRWCISYCDPHFHRGTLYQAAGFKLVRTNKDGLQTWARSLRSLQGHERKRILHLCERTARSQQKRRERIARSMMVQEQLL